MVVRDEMENENEGLNFLAFRLDHVDLFSKRVKRSNGLAYESLGRFPGPNSGGNVPNLPGALFTNSCRSLLISSIRGTHIKRNIPP